MNITLKSLKFRSSVDCAVHCFEDGEYVGFRLEPLLNKIMCHMAYGLVDYAFKNAAT